MDEPIGYKLEYTVNWERTFYLDDQSLEITLFIKINKQQLFRCDRFLRLNYMTRIIN